MSNKYTEKPIPTSRLSRFAKLGSLATSLTGNIIKNSVSAAFNAENPSTQNTLLNINNAKTLTKHLAQMRGAAMKIGQMLSMDAGELLPPEWEPILAVLREQANSMPKHQLLDMLNQHWGSDWADKFEYFSFEPIAAASIGQVHKAKLKTGESLAVKVQYPGVSKSIDSDIDNVAGLLKLTRLMPKGLDIESILTQAKAQLKQEADYRMELAYLEKYQSLLKKDPRYLVPSAYKPLSNEFILCMEFVEGTPISQLAEAPKNLKNTIIENLMELVFNELFTFQFTQSDPNFANFLYQEDSQKLVLLDFGACRTLSDKACIGYTQMARAMQAQNGEAMLAALLNLGLLSSETPEHVNKIVGGACLTASESLQVDAYNFKQSKIIKRLQQETMALIADKDAIASPDFDIALINRKITGTVMLANKMDADVRLRSLLAPFISGG
ncbi:MAG: putative unusual protein kinase regulating ubiquinone biosynthesis (AarF/ABC1/UbiB family) [Alphaproteobacteria bacterium]|jgi:predicted unusual protein kinase regulating ubiquinone biosynthesis (AarF/ABC1/UbiB family)